MEEIHVDLISDTGINNYKHEHDRLSKISSLMPTKPSTK